MSQRRCRITSRATPSRNSAGTTRRESISGMPIGKPWLPIHGADPREIPGTVGVYELGDEGGSVIYIGYAGGRSLMGLRGAILSHAKNEELNSIIQSQARRFR